MNPVVILLGGLVTAATVGTVVYVTNSNSKETALAAERERARQLEHELFLSQAAATQYQQQAQAPAVAQPTRQGQTAGGAVASLIDGAVGLWSLLS